MNPVGTLLSPNPEIQPILPMGLLASELKCDIRWDDTACKVWHPDRGQLEIVMKRNCPEMGAPICLELRAEVEQERAATMMRAIKPVAEVVGDRGWHQLSDSDFLNAVQEWVGREFVQAPEAVRDCIAPQQSHTPSASGLNRHTRRRLERGSAFIHLFSGAQKWDHPGNTPSLSLDLQRGYDLHDDALFWYLLQLGRRGDISYVLGGPPCRTFTTLRARAEGPNSDGGPRVLRAREGDGRYGLPHLTQDEQSLAHGDAVDYPVG